MSLNAFHQRIRSVYIVPGNQDDLVRQAPSYGPDAVVIDFQASVPATEVPNARAALADNVEALRTGGTNAVILRVNDIARGGVADLEATVGAPVDAVVLPNATPEGVRLTDQILDALDWPIGIIPLPETPATMARSLDLLTASDRVVAFIAGSGPRWGDAQRVLGFEWSPAGMETLFLRSQYLLHARAAGLEHIIGCAWANIDDVDGLRKHIESYKCLGYTGYAALHPSQIAVIHDTFRPSADEIEHAHRVLEAFDDAGRRGIGVIQLGGEMIALQCGRDMANRVLAEAQTSSDPAHSSAELA
jgi:citrate lyase subunit beta / citryl-CoA lyase